MGSALHLKVSLVVSKGKNGVVLLLPQISEPAELLWTQKNMNPNPATPVERTRISKPKKITNFLDNESPPEDLTLKALK